jgi:peroxiredoxin family protein
MTKDELKQIKKMAKSAARYVERNKNNISISLYGCSYAKDVPKLLEEIDRLKEIVNAVPSILTSQVRHFRREASIWRQIIKDNK